VILPIVVPLLLAAELTEKLPSSVTGQLIGSHAPKVIHSPAAILNPLSEFVMLK